MECLFMRLLKSSFECRGQTANKKLLLHHDGKWLFLKEKITFCTVFISHFGSVSNENIFPLKQYIQISEKQALFIICGSAENVKRRSLRTCIFAQSIFYTLNCVFGYEVAAVSIMYVCKSLSVLIFGEKPFSATWRHCLFLINSFVYIFIYLVWHWGGEKAFCQFLSVWQVE